VSNLLRLTYLSRAAPDLEPSAIHELLSLARTRNAERGLSGLLVSGRGFFVQALEGPEAAVVTMYARIAADPRHSGVSLLGIGLVAKLAFKEWAMAHVDGEVLGGAWWSRVIADVKLEREVSDTAKLLQSLLKSLRKAA
jgi:hypothetical protein